MTGWKLGGGKMKVLQVISMDEVEIIAGCFSLTDSYFNSMIAFAFGCHEFLSISLPLCVFFSCLLIAMLKMFGLLCNLASDV